MKKFAILSVAILLLFSLVACGSSSGGSATTTRRPQTTTTAHVHSYQETITLKPSCQQTGIATYSCKGCSHTYTKTLSKVGHDTEVFYCKVCNLDLLRELCVLTKKQGNKANSIFKYEDCYEWIFSAESGLNLSIYGVDPDDTSSHYTTILYVKYNGTSLLSLSFSTFEEKISYSYDSPNGSWIKGTLDRAALTLNSTSLPHERFNIASSSTFDSEMESATRYAKLAIKYLNIALTQHPCNVTIQDLGFTNF